MVVVVVVLHAGSETKCVSTSHRLIGQRGLPKTLLKTRTQLREEESDKCRKKTAKKPSSNRPELVNELI